MRQEIVNPACAALTAAAAVAGWAIARAAGLGGGWTSVAIAAGPAMLAACAAAALRPALCAAEPDRRTVTGIMTLLGTAIAMIPIAPVVHAAMGRAFV